MQQSLSYYSGFLKIWKSSPTQQPELVLDKQNTILYQGSDLLAKALSGDADAFISHMYIGYQNANDNLFSIPVVNKDILVNPFTDYTDPTGYLRIPLSFPATFANETNYDNNIVVFTTQISGSLTGEGSSAVFQDSAPESRVYEAALVAGLGNGDKVFSRITFDPIIYDQDYNLTISWGVKFTS